MPSKETSDRIYKDDLLMEANTFYFRVRNRENSFSFEDSSMAQKPGRLVFTHNRLI